jgi:hypothetical protein
LAIEEGSWTIWGAKAAIGAAVLALPTLIILTYQVFFLPKRQLARRRDLLRDPVDVLFLVPPKDQRSVDYAVQDESAHLLDELTIPPFSTTVVEIWMRPRTTFTTWALQFGCSHEDGDEATHRNKPKPIEVDRVYMKKA